MRLGKKVTLSNSEHVFSDGEYQEFRKDLDVELDAAIDTCIFGTVNSNTCL